MQQAYLSAGGLCSSEIDSGAQERARPTTFPPKMAACARNPAPSNATRMWTKIALDGTAGFRKLEFVDSINRNTPIAIDATMRNLRRRWLFIPLCSLGEAEVGKGKGIVFAAAKGRGAQTRYDGEGAFSFRSHLRTWRPYRSWPFGADQNHLWRRYPS